MLTNIDSAVPTTSSSISPKDATSRKPKVNNNHKMRKTKKLVKCSICQRGFRTKGNMMVHKKTHNKKKTSKRSVCQKYSNKQEEENKLLMNWCFICQKSFIPNESLKKLMKTHRGASEEESDVGSDQDVSDQELEEPPLFSMPRSFKMYMDDSYDEAPVVSELIILPWPPVPLNRPKPQPEPIQESKTSSYDLDKFYFNWSQFPSPQIGPDLRREPFSDIHCGATALYASPYYVFTAIWDREIMELIVKETNKYARETLENTMNMPQWVNTTVDELYVYLAVLMATAVVVQPTIECYWSKFEELFSTPGFSDVMRYDRFLLLDKCLHFVDNSNCNPGMSRSEANIAKIRPILDHLNSRYPRLYNMSRNVAIALDESMCTSKGLLGSHQSFNNKAVGIKTYEVCETKSGYVWRSEVVASLGKAEHQEGPISGPVPALVLRLVNGLENRGHTIWLDSCHNSPSLARELKTRGFDCAGTLRTNREFVPNELKMAKEEEKPMAEGEVIGLTSGDVDLMVWRDVRRVAFISTFHGNQTLDCGQTQNPIVAHDYKTCMGGVDRKDQMLSNYPIERRRTKIWYKKLFKRLLNSSVLNAYILLKAGHKISHHSFRKILIEELIAEHNHDTPSINNPECNHVVAHLPARYEFIPGTNARHGKICSICTKRTIAYCMMCNIPVCPYTCFKAHIARYMQQHNTTY